MNSLISNIIDDISKCKFSLDNEKVLQSELFSKLFKSFETTEREFHLDNKNIIDIYISGIAIETKIHAGAKDIYKQCLRYSKFDSVKAIILVTNRSIGFPTHLNNKPCYVINLGKAWL